MADASQNHRAQASGLRVRPQQFVCAEVWGGNQPADLPVEMPGVHAALYSRPCDGGRGGDVHYLSVCNSGVLTRVCLADVAGHGEAVASVGRQIHRMLRKHMNSVDQRQVLGELNIALSSATDQVPMTTAVMATYYPVGGNLTVSYAGHPPAWFFRRSDHSWTALQVDRPPAGRGAPTDLPLAVFPQVEFQRLQIRARRGDRLLLLTDGVLELPDAQGRLLQEAGLRQILESAPAGSVERLSTEVLAALRDYAGGAIPPHDDLSLIALEFHPFSGVHALGLALRNRLRPRKRAHT